MSNIKEVLLTAIAIERYGQDYYSRLSQAVSEEEGKALMKSLERDEKEHEEVIIKEYNRLVGSQVPEKLDIKTDLTSKAIDDIFRRWERSIHIGSEDVFAALETGIGTEQRSIDFYSDQMSQSTDPQLKGIFQNLVEIEKGHKKLLEDNIFHLKQDGSWWGYVPILEG